MVPEGCRQGHPRARRLQPAAHPRNRSRSAPRRDRLHHRGGGDRRPAGPLVSLRPDLERCGGHRAGPADRPGVGHHRRRSRAAVRGPRSAAPGSSKTRPWSAARTAFTPSPSPSASSWPTGIRRCSATSSASSAAAEDMRVGKFSGAVGTLAHLSPELEEKICARLGLKAAADFFAGDPARPPCPLSGHARGDCVARWTRSPPRSAICSAPRSAKPKSSSAKSRKARRPCRTSAIP